MHKVITKDNLPSFSGLTSFAHWYVNNGLPVLRENNVEVFVTDDATSTSLFRYGRYQVEMYMIHPNPVVPLHEHPGVKNIEFTYINYDKFLSFSEKNFEEMILRDGQSHGGDLRVRSKMGGFLLLSIQEWSEGLEITTIGSRWKGHTSGKKHEELIRRFNPDCFMYPGYADVTRKNIKREIL